MLSVRGDSGKAAVPAMPEQEAIPAAEMQALRHRFLQEGQERIRQMLVDLDDEFHSKEAARTVHQWVGTAGYLGYMPLARQAREVEALLRDRPVDSAQARESLTNLLLAFSTPKEAQDTPVPEAIVRALRGKCAAIVGLPAHETQLLCVALERVRARAMAFELSRQFSSSPPRMKTPLDELACGAMAIPPPSSIMR